MEIYVTIKEAKEKYGIDLTKGVLYRVIGDRMKGSYIEESVLKAAKDKMELPEKNASKSEPKTLEELWEG